MDYLGVFDDVAKAFKFDDTSVRQIITNIEELKSQLVPAMAAALSFFPGVDRTGGGYEGLVQAQAAIADDATKDAFGLAYSVVSQLWETMSPDPMLTSHEADYRWLTDVYESVRPADVTGRLVWLPRQREAYTWFTAELANLRTAFRWAADHGDLDVAAAIATYTAFLGLWVIGLRRTSRRRSVRSGCARSSPRRRTGRWTAGETVVEMHPDQMLVVPPNTPHGFRNIGDVPLLTVSIHESGELDQTFLGVNPA